MWMSIIKPELIRKHYEKRKKILIQKQAKYEPIFAFSLPGRQFAPLSVTPLPLSLFTAQYNNFTCLWISSSCFSEAFNHTSRFWLGQKTYLYTIQKNIRWSRLFIVFVPKKYTNSLLAIKSDFVFSSTVTINIQKTESSNARLYIAKKYRISQQKIQSWHDMQYRGGQLVFDWDRLENVLNSRSTGR